ncbi:C40 family peptidase [Peribacillus glennii]|uniref:NlpC/P60 family protein n=1 Tax=Peribacillus glennii TaxID=2303991 RepID=A0A372L8G9_9BACI|nr:C40 family peptidase [Peribacillus glennii]RFU61632.1 NlpC/P60 family protein [Peribacillus glennii]
MNVQVSLKSPKFLLSIALIWSLVFSFIVSPIQAKAVQKVTAQQGIVKIAKQNVGKPYKYGGTTPKGFDASGFVQYVYNTSSVKTKLPRTVMEQYKKGTSVKQKNLMAGDLVFFKTSGTKVSFVGIYIGENKFIAATQSKGVSTVSLATIYWKDHYVGAKRILK